LLGGENRLRDVYQCIVNYETGDWDKLCGQLDKLGTDEATVSGLYSNAVEWGYRCFRE
jgi:hypothetical protein